MQHHEKKYRVDSFEQLGRQLRAAGAKPKAIATSTHYYAQHDGSGVVKLIVKDGRNEIHILEEKNGLFSLQETIKVASKNAGLTWLEKHGYHKLTIVDMSHTDYPYKGGVVGLYVINGTLHSVILDYPAHVHPAIERELGLDGAEIINVPYNKYLENSKRSR